MNDETSSDTMVLAPVAADLSRFAPAREADNFGYFLLIAAALHAMTLIGFISSAPSRLGSPGGADQAISVSLISSEDLESRSSVDDAAAGQPVPPPPASDPEPPVPPEGAVPPTAAPPVAAPPAPAAEALSEPGESEQKTEPAKAQPETAAALLKDAPSNLPETVDEPREAEKVAKAPDSQSEQAIPALRDSITDVPVDPATNTKTPAEAEKADPAAKPQPDEPVEERKADAADGPTDENKKPQNQSPAAQKPSPTKPKPRPQKKTETASLEAPSPPVVFSAPQGGGGAGVQRPPGITRSGENDAFARGVIRALQRTMPHLRESTGRVTVRIKLDTNGNLASTTVVRPSRVAGMDQSVVFATHQSSFPLPPLNANAADLTFIVTYIYR